MSDYAVVQTRRFARQDKKLHDNVGVDVDEAAAKVATGPNGGVRKKDNLADLRVVKFRNQGKLDPLGYAVVERVRLVYLEAVGSQENFYRDLKRN